MKEIELDEESQEFEKLREKWFSFRPESEKDLFNFIHELTTKYNHDYGTSAHMCVALMSAIFRYCNNLEGYTGFQVGCMQWEVLQEVFRQKDSIGMKFLKYEDLIYPQYQERFCKVKLDKTQVEKLQKLAKDNLNLKDYIIDPKVKEYWEKLASGWLPDFIVVEEE